MQNRLDIELVNRGLVESREKAKAYIMAGAVYVDGQKAFKAGDKVKDGAQLEVRGTPIPFVSRGGLKLDKAIKSFDISLDDNVCMDIGASTGGFTDCMLQNGAAKVYAVDVGYGQLAWKLRCDERVVNIERTNIRYIDNNLIGDELDFISIDVSFISLKLVLPVVSSLLKNGGRCVALVKPQFEAGRDEVGKKGVVRDKKIHKKVIKECIGYAVENGLTSLSIEYSPIKGPEGNIEFLLYITKSVNMANSIDEQIIDDIVENAHNNI